MIRTIINRLVPRYFNDRTISVFVRLSECLLSVFDLKDSWLIDSADYGQAGIKTRRLPVLEAHHRFENCWWDRLAKQRIGYPLQLADVYAHEQCRTGDFGTVERKTQNGEHPIVIICSQEEGKKDYPWLIISLGPT